MPASPFPGVPAEIPLSPLSSVPPAPTGVAADGAVPAGSTAPDPRTLLTRAEAFLWGSGRVLERRVFATLFRDEGPSGPLQALRAHRNADGGFGQALEPELRTPDTQPSAIEYALDVLGRIDVFDDEIIVSVLEQLTRHTTSEGGIPAVWPGVGRAPAPRTWLECDPHRASLRATASVVGRLLGLGVEHPWIERASDFCWRGIARLTEPLDLDPAAPVGGAPSARVSPPRFESLRAALRFLDQAPDAARAIGLLEEIGELVLEWDLVAFEVEGRATSPSPLDWAPTPRCFARNLFTTEQIERHLRALVRLQHSDGGWPLSGVAPTAAAAAELRGRATLDALWTLRAYGVLAR